MKGMAALLAAISTGAAAQVISAEWQLPNWAQPKWRAFRESQPFALSLRVNPFVWQGDFDGDKATDVAIMIKCVSDGKEGIAVLWRNGATPTILGAGAPLAGTDDDLSWVNFWGVEERGSLQEGDYADTITLDADALIVSKGASDSGLIYFIKGEPRWQQQGD
jgi:hypothetical protein